MLIAELNLKKVVHEILSNAGSDACEAELVAAHLVRANMTGHDSHGVGMLPTYIKDVEAGLLIPGMQAELVKDDGAIMIFDGRRGYGQCVAKEAMDAAIQRCTETGIVVMSLRTAHHIGRIGSYGEQSIDAGLVSLHFVNVIDYDPVVAPHGGRDARYLTNPICIAIPGSAATPSIMLDMATSKIAMGKARVAMNRNKPVAPGTILDAQGDPTVDPAVLFRQPRGSLLPFGEHKGFGLALMCEILGGVLTGGGTIQPGNQRMGSLVNNMLTFVVDPRRLVDHAWMESEIDAVIRHVKASPPANDAGEVMVAGDPERKIEAERQVTGIPVEDATWEEIMQAGEAVGLSRARLESLV